jgi:hypothetical protein
MIRPKDLSRHAPGVSHNRRIVRRILAAAILCGGFTVGVVVHVAEAAAPHSGESRPTRAAREAATSMDAYPQQEYLFTALRGSPSTPDPSVMALAEAMATADAQSPSPSGLQPTLIRNVYSDGDTTSGILPTTRGVCLVAIVGGAGVGACASTATAAQHGIVVQQEEGPSSLVVGVLPDGATNAVIENSDGSGLAVVLNAENGFAIPVDQPRAFTYTDDGATHTIEFEGASPVTSAQQG